jgi:CubicO group peptidase (beta-lactamase class C family)
VFGRHTPRAFGHLGFTNVVMFADPERDVAVCLMTSGKPFFALGILRIFALLDVIARACPRTRAAG